MQSSPVRFFLDALSPVNVGVHLTHSSSRPFPSPFEFRFGEPVGETKQGSYLPVAFLSKFSGHVFCLVLSCFSFARSSFCGSVLISMSVFEKKTFDFMLEMSLGHQLQSATVVFHFADCSFLCVDLKSFRLFNLHLVQTVQYAVGRSINDCG